MSDPYSSADQVPEISVIIPTYGRRENVTRLIRGLLADPDVQEVVVVPDGPDPLLEQDLAACADPRLVVLVLAVNGGQAAAREAGARIASGTILLLIDDDVEVVRGTVKGHARAHTCDPYLVVVGHNPVALPPVRRPGLAASYLYQAEYERAWHEVLNDSELVLRRLWAGHFSVRREHFLAVSGTTWRESYHEDRDLGLRLKAAGLHGRALAELRSQHHHSRTLAQSVEEARRQGRALALLTRHWPDQEVPDYATRPGPLGLLARLSRPRPSQAVVSMALRVAAAAGALHLWGLETASLRLGRQAALRAAFATADKRIPAVR